MNKSYDEITKALHENQEKVRGNALGQVMDYLRDNDFVEFSDLFNGSYWQSFEAKHKSGFCVSFSFRLGSTDTANWSIKYYDTLNQPKLERRIYGQSRSTTGFKKLFKRVKELTFNINYKPTDQ